MIIDTHVHIASSDTDRYPFAVPTGASRNWWRTGRYGASQLISAMDSAGVERAIAVQSTGAYGDDNRYLLDVVEQTMDRLRGVVAINMDRKCPADTLQELCRTPGIVGVRIVAMAEDVPWMTDGRAEELWAAAGESGTVICLTTYSSRLPLLEGVLDHHPSVPVVIEHCGLAQTDEGFITDEDPLLSMAAVPGVSVKVSSHNLLQAGEGAWPLLEQLATAFGPQRLTWGSDYPQSATAGYGSAVELAEGVLAPASADFRDSFMAENAARVYGWGADSR